MELKDVLLTDEEIKQVYRKEKLPAIFNFVFEGAIAKAAQLKLLKVLEDKGNLTHEISHLSGECWPDCWLCKLKKELGGE